jgi:hypothetical protein
VFALLFIAILVRHANSLGYLSERHALPLVLVSMPWAASGLRTVWDRATNRFHLAPRRSRRLAAVLIAMAVVGGLAFQSRPTHPSRWGHQAAGEWLRKHAHPGDAVLDTRGWAGFLSGLPAYSYWHVRQALTDSRLRYVVVDRVDVEAKSDRARTLKALLAFAATEVAAFPARQEGGKPAVWVYRFQAPDSWEDFRP